MQMTAENLAKARRRMFYIYILYALQGRRYAVRREWLEDYFIPLTLLALKKYGMKMLDIERDHRLWPGLYDTLGEAESLEIIKSHGHASGMFTFETDTSRLLKVVSTADKCFKKSERPIVERAAKDVVKLYLGGMSYKHAELLYKEEPEPSVI